MEAFYFVLTVAAFAMLCDIGYKIGRINGALWAIWREMKDQNNAPKS